MRSLRCLLLLLALLPASTLLAQKKPKENAEVLVNIIAGGYGVPTTGNFLLRFWEVGGSGDLINNGFNATGAGAGAWAFTPGYPRLMKPGRHYQAILSSGGWEHGELKVSAPAGYTVYINDVPVSTIRTDEYSGGMGTFLVYKVDLRPNADSAYLPAGMSLPPQAGDFVWTMSAGRYATGLSVGALQLRATDITGDLLDPRSLSMAEPTNSEVQLNYNSDGAVQEVRTNQFVAYVRRNSTPGTGYHIEVYDPLVYHPETGDTPYTYYDAFGGSLISPFREFDFSGNGTNTITIEKIERSGATVTKDTTWTISKTVSGTSINWNVTETSGIRKTKLLGSKNTSTGVTTEIATVENSDGSDVSIKATRVYQDFAWGQSELVQEIDDPDGLALTTSWTYNTNSSSSAYGRLESVTHADGSWERYVYDDSQTGWGNLISIYRPFQDAPTTPVSATSGNCQAILLSYTTDHIWPGNDSMVFATLPSGTETKTNNVTTAKNVITYSSIYGGLGPNYGDRLQNQTIQTFSSSGASTTATLAAYHNRYAADQYRGRPAAQIAPDGTQSSYLRYQAHFFNNGDNNSTLFQTQTGSGAANSTWGEYQFSGFSTAVTSAVAVNTWDGRAIYPLYMVPNRSTVGLTIYDDQGRPWFKVQYVFTGASNGAPTFEFAGMDQFGYTNGVQSYHSTQRGELLQQEGYIGEALTGRTFNDGQYVEYTRDSLNRDYMDRHWYVDASGEYPAQGIIYTHKTFDIAGRTLTEKISSSSDAGALPADAVRKVHTFNKAGLPTSDTAEADGGNFVTTYSYSNGGRTVTTTLPGGATKIVEHRLDGTLKSVTGTAVPNEYHTLTVNGDGTITKTDYLLRSADLGSPTGAPRWIAKTLDWAGRTVSEQKPAFGGTTFTKQYSYNSAGQLIKMTEPGQAPTIIDYDAWQNPYRTGLHFGTGDQLVTASLDRITETDTYFEKDGSAAWWSVKSEKRYNVDNSSGTTPTTYVKTRLNKFDDQGRYYGSYVQQQTKTIDLFGNVTDKTVDVRRGSSYFANDLRLVTETTTYSDSTAPEVKVKRNGFVQKQQSKQGLVTRFYYDGRGRLVKQTDPRTDISTTARIGYVANSDRVAWRQDTAGNQTNYAYDSSTGRLFSETNPLLKAVYHGYDYFGREVRTWGAATYPVEYAFDDYGAKTAMRTFRTSTDFTAGAWPLADDTDPKRPDASAWTSGDKTTWTFDAPTGLLLSKTDAGTATQAPQTVSYTYNARGQLDTRTWARGVTTTYAYSSTTAEQTGITYSDSTPALSYTYNRLGQSATVGDVTGTRTLLHCVCGKVTQETLDAAYFGGRILTYKLDATGTGTLGRTVGYQLGISGSPGLEADITYGYDALDRFNGLSMLGGPAYTYSYATNSNLIGSITDSASGWTETMSYNSTRDLLDSVDGQFSAAHKATFAYAYDGLGRRTSLVSSGEIFDRYSGAGLHNIYSYNDRSEVTGATGYTGQNVSDTSTASKLGGRDFGYNYDPIGNRASSSVDGSATSYAANALNQYISRSAPGSTWVTGLAPASATVTVNGATTGRWGDYYALSVTAGSRPLWQSFAVTSSLGGSVTRIGYVAPSPENLSYDFDGNLTDDGRWHYTWDAENRLTSMESSSAAYGVGAPRQLISFKYDYLGRRVRKTVANWNGSTYVASVDRKFIYDGWNLLAEYDSLTSFTRVRSYLWGLDLTRTLQDGGGVGGLLAVIDVSSGVVHQPFYDSNGNIHALVDRSTGVVTAAYEFSAFGETLRATGTYAQSNPFRFSTKYTDDETGLVCYIRRYYDPKSGRWLGRDPLEEKGGLHLYGFVGNNPINKWDYLGMDPPVGLPTYSYNGNPGVGSSGASWNGSTYTVYGTPVNSSFGGFAGASFGGWSDGSSSDYGSSSDNGDGSGVSSDPDAERRSNCAGIQSNIINIQKAYNNFMGTVARYNNIKRLFQSDPGYGEAFLKTGENMADLIMSIIPSLQPIGQLKDAFWGIPMNVVDTVNANNAGKAASSAAEGAIALTGAGVTVVRVLMDKAIPAGVEGAGLWGAVGIYIVKAGQEFAPVYMNKENQKHILDSIIPNYSEASVQESNASFVAQLAPYTKSYSDNNCGDFYR